MIFHFWKNTLNIKVLNLAGCKKIRGFSYIKNAEKLEVLKLNDTNITDISFLSKNKNLKTLNLTENHNIKDFS